MAVGDNEDTLVAVDKRVAVAQKEIVGCLSIRSADVNHYHWKVGALILVVPKLALVVRLLYRYSVDCSVVGCIIAGITNNNIF